MWLSHSMHKNSPQKKKISHYIISMEIIRQFQSISLLGKGFDNNTCITWIERNGIMQGEGHIYNTTILKLSLFEACVQWFIK